MAKNVSEPEMAEMATEELATLRPAYEKAEQKIRFGIVPPDENDSRNTIVEIRAGVGGDEAAPLRRRTRPNVHAAMRSGSAGRPRRSS